MAHHVFSIPFADIYPLYLAKIERKGRREAELAEVLTWLTGYDAVGLMQAQEDGRSLEEFFAQAPALNPDRELITGSVCGVRVQEVEDPLMRDIRYMDKLVDELAKGRPMEKILRS
ncbi:MAG: DUF2200 domain-containing protein [Actinomyces urogenitalis]|uniref:DUF2200 domain-containing protein n=1 Tax=Actinomyces urogenitalis TaxID=103621 RepID=UPI002432D374|nr:DUF2200 domain-containing protein [Actinomyces urogenitalis]MCI7456464.1 DUF2200 domain-containing protein [Actinomyces urogenitalis]MDY3678905.1 DUF2200 domain-containing protein [Actinomyces urogenitalis]